MNTGKRSFDVVIIGSGASALTVAGQCNSAGLKVAVVDYRPFGGTCALRGCDPKKALITGEEAVDWNKRINGHGLSNAENVAISWPELMKFKRSFTEPMPENIQEWFTNDSIEGFHGTAHFTSENTIEIAQNNERSEQGDNSYTITVEGKKILVACGNKPTKLGIAGEEYISTSDDFLELDNLPDKVIFIGGGYISFEFAHLAARAGKKATILQRGNVLPNFDRYLVEKLVEKTQRIGIDVKENVEVKRVEKTKDGFSVSASNKSGDEFNIEGELVVHGAGRTPNIEKLSLEKGNVDYDAKKGIRVNEYLQSVSNPSVYAAGDVAFTDGLPLTPVGIHEGYVAANNIVKGNSSTTNYKGTPSVVFTIPPLASVGLTEKKAKDQGIKTKSNKGDSSTWYTSRRINQDCSGYHIVLEADSEKIVGAHILGHNSEEVINIFALAIRFGLTATDLKNMIYTYPTSASDIRYML